MSSSYVEELQFDVQAKTKQGREYDPLIRLNDSLCWPSAPRYELLENATTFKKNQHNFESHWDRRKVATRALRVGRDFDFVVLGVSIGAIRHVCTDMIKQNPRWAAMVRNVKTVATQAFQLWMRKDMAELGWPHPAVTLTALGNAFDTWSDMTHMIPAEQWAAPDMPRSLAYFCGVLPDDGSERPRPRSGAFNAAVLRQQSDKVGANAIAFLNDKATRLWPNAKSANSFDWKLLVDPSNPKTVHTDPKAAIKSQYCIANVNPTDRYVLSLPGSLRASHLAAGHFIRQPDDRGGLDRLRVQRRLRGGRGDVRQAGRTCDFPLARPGADHWLRSPVTGDNLARAPT